MPSSPSRQVVKHGFALWTKPASTVVWFEIAKGWADGLIGGNAMERAARMLVLNLIAPGFGTAMNLVLEHYRTKLKKYIGPAGIWIAVKVPDPKALAQWPLVYVYAKKRTDANKLTAPEPWEPTTGNIV